MSFLEIGPSPAPMATASRLLGLGAACLLMGYLTAALFVGDGWNSVALSHRGRIRWTVAIFLAIPIALPLYWLLQIRSRH